MLCCRHISYSQNDDMNEDERIKAILGAYDRAADKYRRLGIDVEQLLKRLLGVAEIPISSIGHRLKERDSLEKKLRSSDKYKNLWDVTDTVGARVITFFADDVDRVADIICRQENFAIDWVNTVDKRRKLKSDQFGYQSLHLVASLSKQRIFSENSEYETLKIEIQVRSLIQHAWAEFEHAYYKSARSLPSSFARRVFLLAGLLELGDKEFKAVRNDAAEIARFLPPCRADGYTELVPEFWLDVPWREILADDLQNTKLVVMVNTNITNRIVEDRLTEAEMYVEDSAGRTIPRKGSIAGVNALSFSQVLPPTIPEKQEFAKIRISGLRINAFQKGVSTSLVPRTIEAGIAFKTAEDSDKSTSIGEYKSIVRIVPSVEFSVTNLEETISLPVKMLNSDSVQEVAMRIRCEPLFTHAIRSAHKERSPTETSDIRGTRVIVSLWPAPVGSRVYATIQELPNTAGLPSFRLTNADLNGDGPFDPMQASATRRIGASDIEVAEVAAETTQPPIIIGSGLSHCATWECVGTVPEGEVPSVAVFVELPPHACGAKILATCTLGPVSVVGVAYSASPTPRFFLSHAPVSVIEFS
jgi:ppGpp synthetase/RelA/SpoT-type nucleotidyltranferase